MDRLVSVTEYAAIYEKDPGNIRRHLSSGRMTGRKIGKQWVLSLDEPYPSDRRETTGEYRNWRDRVRFNSDKELSREIKELVSELNVIYGSSLVKVVLYGSYARGTQTDESDVDIAIFLNVNPDKKQKDAELDCIVRHELNTGRTISVVDIEMNKYIEWGESLPFYRNIDKEGVTIWQAQ